MADNPFDNKALIAAAEWDAVLLSLVEIGLAVTELMARVGAPEWESHGLRDVRARLNVALASRDGDSWLLERFPPPKRYADGLPEPLPVDGNTGRPMVPSGALDGAAWDQLTGGGAGLDARVDAIAEAAAKEKTR